MPSLVEVLLHPESRRPAPTALEIDVFRVITVGTAAWLIALVVGGLLFLNGTASWEVPMTCATGAALGGVGWWHERRRARRHASTVHTN